MKKALLFLLSLCLLLMAGACSSPSREQQPMTYEEQKQRYSDVVDQFTALLITKDNGEELSPPNTDKMNDEERAIATALFNTVNVGVGAKGCGYGYKDLDGNGTLELLLMAKNTSILAIFTLSDDQPILLASRDSLKDYFVFAAPNRLLINRITETDSTKEATYYTCHIDGDRMVYDQVFGELYNSETKETIEYFQIVNGERVIVVQDTFHELYWEHQKVPLPGYLETIKMICPRVYFPLAEPVTDATLPVADFSSYDSIKTTYLAISSCIDNFSSLSWSRGEYDELFSFPNDVAFEYYAKLLYIAYRCGGITGYDEIDLNGDGQDELVLLNEAYEIKAIFTQKDGQPVLLDAFAHLCWLDSQGFLHIDRADYSYNELEYSLYEFTKDGEYRLSYSILLNKNYDRYLTKDGKTEKITYEESMDLYYNDYCRYSEPFSPNEETRNVCDLTYTPLTEPTASPIVSALDKTWYKSANLEKTSGNTYGTYGKTYITFDNATDTQLDVNITYKYVEFYPDPDREHYLLDKVTESSLSFTAFQEKDVWVFNEKGIRGRLEFGHTSLWFIIEESTDSRFAVGHHYHEDYTDRISATIGES